MHPQLLADAALVVNVSARAGRRGLRDALAALEGCGVHLAEVVSTGEIDEFVAAVRRVARPQRLVIVGGGDGSMSSAAGPLLESGAVLGVLPLGTGNSFARSLGVPLDIPGACAGIAGGCVARIDAGYANGTPYLNYAAIGLSARVAKGTPARLKRSFGPLAYLAIGFLLTRGDRAFRCTIFANDETQPRFAGVTHQVIVANGRYFGTVPLLDEATLDDGTLTTVVIEGPHRRGLVRYWLAMLGGADPRTLPESRIFGAQRVRVVCDPPKRIEIDGERRGRTPVTFTVEPRALDVVVPPTSALTRER